MATNATEAQALRQFVGRIFATSILVRDGPMKQSAFSSFPASDRIHQCYTMASNRNEEANFYQRFSLLEVGPRSGPGEELRTTLLISLAVKHATHMNDPHFRTQFC